MDEWRIHPGIDRLATFDAGQLGAADWDAVAQHLVECGDCCRRLESLPEVPLAALVRAAARPSRAPTPSADTVADMVSLAGLSLPQALLGHPRYRVLDYVGEGGMGVVYKAIHLLLNRLAALKVLRPALAADAAFVERFRHEVQTMARLDHPNVAAVYDAEQIGDLQILAMEYISGSSLDRLVRERGPLGVPEACDAIRQAARGLQHAFEQGLIHRDVKPANILRTPDGAIKIVDFGLAHCLRGSGPSSAALVGTPEYLAPEQARDPDGVSIRADIYGLGGTLYFLLTGQPPFSGATPLETLLAHQHLSRTSVSRLRADVPAWLVELLERMLARQPADRPATPAEVALALTVGGKATTSLPSPPPYASTPARRSRKWPRLLVAVGLIAALGSGTAWWLHRGQSHHDDSVRPAQDESNPLRDELEFANRDDANRDKRTMRDRAADWLRLNNRWGPDHPFTDSAIEPINANLDNIDGFEMKLGAGLLLSKRPTILAAHFDQLFVFELPQERNGEPSLAPNGRGWFPHRRRGEARRRHPAVDLTNLSLDAADALDTTRPLTGSIHVRRRARPLAPPSRLRRFFYAGGVRHTGLSIVQLPLEAGGEMRFSLPALGISAPRQEPFVVYVDLVCGGNPGDIVESNTLAALVQPAETKPTIVEH